ncbi:acyl-CoA synthetase [Pseudomonas sp. BN102]|uniref:acyl-CoA synthetase n=1 Tax=Pseudomonas sp. BN102 TaxID=2567886 RepID=UPI00245791F5|nr:acyl-CoA synthetase [Pseudomonas sp. BN102]MDH4610449.1 acyl-CoA synthetase [Pseudomonas sp. BN102]
MDNPRYLGDFATLTPEKPAVINGSTGEQLSFRELDERSNRLARYLLDAGLRHGDGLGMFLENNIRCFEVCWAALRSGLQIVPINRFLTPEEAAYIVNDSGAKALVTSWDRRDTVRDLSALIPDCCQRLMLDGCIEGWTCYEDAIAAFPAERLEEEWLGGLMLYSSGTTGRPKGIYKPMPKVAANVGLPLNPVFARCNFDQDSVYLSTAPLYHSAPIGNALAIQCIGATVVFMEKFDALRALELIEHYRITHSQWVPTMFVRLLRLSSDERKRYDLTSLRMANHSAAPCPQDIKRQMIDWWGPILIEYYGSTETGAATVLDSHQWLQHPGSVGHPIPGVTLHICDDEGNEEPTGTAGLIYIERPGPGYLYHNDPGKTREVQHPRQPTWTCVGDIGYLDEDGYLYLTDRKSFMIISGGVNIYPQAIENALVMHTSVGDVAVIGVPNAEMGEEVKAIVEPAPGVTPSEALACDLLAFLDGKIARYMMPRSIEFMDQLPRLPTGKLYKQQLRERYWPKG